MLREIDFTEISDGKRYTNHDMVKADCFGCRGCSACCHGMGESILLDPLDVCRLTEGLSLTFEEFLERHGELNLADGLILPNLRMDGPKEACTFLNEEGRCSVHAKRPGICRMFPLGRIYENRSFQYFLQIRECPMKNRGKVKVKKWLDLPDIKLYETFVADWHYFLTDLAELLDGDGSEVRRKTAVLYLLQNFYRRPFSLSDFYREFDDRLETAKAALGIR